MLREAFKLIKLQDSRHKVQASNGDIGSERLTSPSDLDPLELESCVLKLAKVLLLEHHVRLRIHRLAAMPELEVQMWSRGELTAVAHNGDGLTRFHTVSLLT